MVVARSAEGVTFETIASIPRERSGAESLERPALVALQRTGLDAEEVPDAREGLLGQLDEVAVVQHVDLIGGEGGPAGLHKLTF